MSTIDIINNIKEETNSKLTPAQICYELKKAASGLTEDKIKSYQSEPLSNDKKKEAIDTIGNFLANREADNQMPVMETITNIKEDNIEKLSNPEVEDSNFLSDNNKDKENIDNNTAPPTNDEIKKFVIPIIADKIITNGKDGEEPNTVTYDSDNFSAILRFGEEEQSINLDRKGTTPEDTNALVASKGNNQQEYQIIINNLKHDEFEKFKALFDKATQQKEKSEKENSKGSELD